ncbi:MAG: glycosyl hydrolase [Bacteroidia bacterium]|nr:glycosyl hydrolase [Bacteroidia bacterium]
MSHQLLALICTLLLLVPAHASVGQKNEKKSPSLSSSTLNALKFRAIGPALASGRIGDLAVNPSNHAEYYVAVASGGVWKTTNDGITFEPIFDDKSSYSIGCVTLDPNNPHVVWVGTGENNSQRSVAWGDGVYRSSDGGKSWKHMGLKTSEHIAKILIDPTDSRIVYVASQGPLWGPGGERGLYKSTDGGTSWSAVLTISENTGVTDVVMDPRDPKVLYAASYQRRRHVWTLINGGPEAKIFKTEDGGKSWDTLRSGLPSGDVGRIGLALSPANPDYIYAVIEAAEKAGGVYRSTNRGGSWEKRGNYVPVSPQYYSELVCDPLDPDMVYSLDTYTMVTTDGFKTWNRLSNRARHVDDHALWINPQNTKHLLIGGDGGIYDSYDGGETWRFKENLPVTQFYRVSVDNDEPFYNVYGGTQDNNSIGGPSRTINRDGIFNEHWFFTNGGDGFKSQVDPTDPNVVYAQAQYGVLVRYDKRSDERLGIQPQPGPDEAPYRWNWDSPLIISPHKPTRLYFAANKLFRSEDRGESWTIVSPDLTRQIDRNALPVMGKIWPPEAVAKNASTSSYGNIVALSESPRREGLLYVGTDDGLLQVSEDAGRNWRAVSTFPGIPETTYVSCVLASAHDDNIVYVTFNNHKNADFKPYILRSSDRGKSWTARVGGLPAGGPVHCIIEDHVSPDLLFCGTEFGVFVTTNGGQDWTQMKGGLPTIAVRDLAIQKRENDLVLGTFGRGFYVLDDYTPLRSLSPRFLDTTAAILPGREALMYIPARSRAKGAQGETFFTSPNPPFGATFTLYLKEELKGRKKQRKAAEKSDAKNSGSTSYPDWRQLREEDQEIEPHLIVTIRDESGADIRRLRAPASAGFQRITWDLRHASPAPVTAATNINDASGMPALPGTYTATLAEVIDGVERQIAGPVRFSARVLENRTFPVAEPAALAAFRKEMSETQRSVFGAQRFHRELSERHAAIDRAVNLVPSADAALRNDVLALRGLLLDLDIALNGDETISSRNGDQLPSVVGRMQTLLSQQWSTSSGLTPKHRRELERVRAALSPVVQQLRDISTRTLPAIERTLDSIGAPWTPGRLVE